MHESAYRAILDEMSEGVYFVDLERTITYWNPGAERITGYTAAEVMGRSCADGILRHVTESGHQLCISGCPLAAVMKDGRTRTANVFLHHKEGHRVPVQVKGQAIRDESGEIIGSVELFSARASTRFADQQERNRADDALVDALTGIGNRRYGELHLESMMAAVRAGVTSLGVLFLDVDRFKPVNDTYGHRVGDAVLRMVGQDIANGLRAGDHPVRWGGEEFVVLMPGANDTSLDRAAERLRMLIEHSWFEHGDDQVRVTVSIGAVLAEPVETAADVIDRADRLMYSSKQAGRNLVTTSRGPIMRTGERPLAGNLAPWKMAGGEAIADAGSSRGGDPWAT